jgi:hypothetical protein
VRASALEQKVLLDRGFGRRSVARPGVRLPGREDPLRALESRDVLPGLCWRRVADRRRGSIHPRSRRGCPILAQEQSKSITLPIMGLGSSPPRPAAAPTGRSGARGVGGRPVSQADRGATAGRRCQALGAPGRRYNFRPTTERRRVSARYGGVVGGQNRDPRVHEGQSWSRSVVCS